jgi:hypothetical protein
MVSMQAPLAKLRWTLNRLRSMELSEVAHRMKERARRKAARKSGNVARFDVGDGPLPKIPGLGAQDGRHDDELLACWRRVAETARTGRYRFLGQQWPGIADARKWHLDPKTGKDWPSDAYCFDIPYRHERERGDIKYVWELNRLQFLQPIAALAGAERDANLARWCAAELESWIDANPPFRGVNWASGIELALRIVSVATVTAFIGEEAFSPGQRAKLRSTLAAHGYWLARYPSLHSSANNHLIAEAGGLFLLGVLAPDLPGAAAHEAYGRRTLLAEAQKQIHDDGVGAEQSPSYTAFTVEWLMLCCHVGNMLGRPLPPLVRDRLLHAASHLRWITDEGGNQPRIGDDDEGRVFYSQAEPEDRYVSSILGSLAAMLDRPAIAPPVATAPHLRNLVFGFSRPSQTPMEGVRCFPTGGYTVMRERVGQRRVLAVLDHGPLGYLSIAAHGHADALALTLHVDDQPVLIDAGTYLYHSGGEWRDRFRGTKAHNTLNIDGQDQSIISGPFNWSHKANVHLLHYKDAPGAWCVEAEHDGYQKRYGVNHRRQVARGPDASITCTDWLTGPSMQQDSMRHGSTRHGSTRHGPSRHDMAIEIRYLVAPELEVSSPDAFTARIARNGSPICDLGFFLSSLQGGDALPLVIEADVASLRFGEKMEAAALICRVPSPAMVENGVMTRISFP